MLWHATLAWQRAVRAALAPHDLTHVQFVLLTVLWWQLEHGGAPTQAQLAEQAGTDSMMTSQVIRRLEARALLTRTTDPSDGRARRLELTPSGRELVAEALAAVEAVDRDYFGALGDEQAGFAAALGRLSDRP
jgi:DNA-binding MarR family transcriptional regulator